jgi:hypothetical protein
MNILPTLGPGRPPRPRPKIARRPMLMPTFSLPMANRRRLAEDDGDDEYISSDTDEPSLGASASRVNSGSGSGSLGPNGPSTQSSWRDSTVLHGVVTEEPESLPLKVSVDTNRDLPPLPGRKRGFSLPLRISSLPAFPGLPAAITSPRIASFAGGILDRVVPERARSLSQPRRKRGKGNSKSRGNQGIGKSKKNDGDYTSAKSHMDKRRSFGWPCDPAMPDGEREPPRFLLPLTSRPVHILGRAVHLLRIPRAGRVDRPIRRRGRIDVPLRLSNGYGCRARCC